MNIRANRLEGFLLLLIGLLIYYVLFSSFSISDKLHKEGLTGFQESFIKVWKLLIFTLSQLIIRKFIKERWKNFSLLGIGISILGSILLYKMSSNNLSFFPVNYYDILLLLAIESIGESLVASSILTYIRIKNNNKFYIKNTILFRTGQNLGMFLSLLGTLSIPENNPLLALIYIRLLILIFITFFVFKKKVLNSEESLEQLNILTGSTGKASEWENKKHSKKSIISNTILGACSYSLFYILVFSPMHLLCATGETPSLFTFLGSHQENSPLIMNSMLALVALIFLIIFIPNAIENKLTKSSFISLLLAHKIAILGILFSVIFWSISLVSYCIEGLVLLSGVFGFFSLTNYIIAEARVGLMHAENKPKNIITYVSYSRFGLLFGIFIPLLLIDNDSHFVRILIALIAIAGALTALITFKNNR